MKRVARQGFAGKSFPRNRNRRALPAVSELFQALIALWQFTNETSELLCKDLRANFAVKQEQAGFARRKGTSKNSVYDGFQTRFPFRTGEKIC
ncbi:MAG: hypothetical protein LBS65_04195 [Desulfovibrio sp.]|jgi:hypothetical protein|nr:hypothetical protein [Desulfovibrio sp.]